MTHTIAIIGGGAAGLFAAIRCKECAPTNRVIVIEKSATLLSKVRISGGGRCNVTHACFDPALLVKNYPRGEKELRGPLSRFQPKDTFDWFEKRGVALKIEADGRVFPTTDSSQTIIDCFLKSAKAAGVEFLMQHAVNALEKTDNTWCLHFESGSSLNAQSVLIATGGSPKMFPLLKKLGHTTLPLVPSLFTFNIPTSPFFDQSGISIPEVSLKLPAHHYKSSGPLLLTHFGLSGPAVLKLSAYAARELHDCGYKTDLLIDWLPTFTEVELSSAFHERKKLSSAALVSTSPLFDFPKHLWKKFTALASISENTLWRDLSLKQIREFTKIIKTSTLKIDGKTTHKQEFVTCGGIALSEVNFKTMESRLHKNLFFAGEVLDIDAVTGGFNFQNAWTTGWIAAEAIATQSPT